MTAKKLTRTTYLDQSGGQRIGASLREEVHVDVTKYHKPLEQVHVSTLHGWGVASGLRVSGVLGQQDLQVETGVALDSSGRHISLAEGGKAEIGPNADNPGVSPVLADVLTDGVKLPTAGLNGAYFLTIRWRETFDDELLSGGRFQVNHTPWLKLYPVAGFSNDGTGVVLARVEINGGIVQALASEMRRGTEATFEVVHVVRHRGEAAPSAAVSHAEAATIRPRPAGGLTIVADKLALQSLAGQENFVIDVTANMFGIPNVPSALHLSETRLVDDGNGLTLSNPDRILVDAPYIRAGKVGVDLPTDGGGPIQLDVASRMRVRQRDAGSAGIWFFQGNADRAFVGMVDVAKVGFYGRGAGWGFVMDTASGNVGVGVTQPSLRLDVADRMRVREGASGSAGIWFSQNNAPDRAFVGMLDNDSVGFYGSGGAGWSFAVDTRNGNARLPAGHLSVAKQVFTNWVQASRDQDLFLSAGHHRTVRVDRDLHVFGRITKGVASSFTIDHPLEPANRYLSHSVVESPEMLNVYSGNLTTDAEGEAIVDLPSYFEALNRDFRYQLTVIGQIAQAFVAREVEGNRFAIKTDKAHVKVSWQVSGVRQDAYAKAHPIAVEEDKPERERGLFIHPELYGEPESRSLVNAWQPAEQASSEYGQIKPDESGMNTDRFV